jgi:hypothetical protein
MREGMQIEQSDRQLEKADEATEKSREFDGNAIIERFVHSWKQPSARTSTEEGI